MGWEDRPYYRDREPSSSNPLMWLLTGSVPLFTLFGVRVRAHATLLVLLVGVLLFGFGQGANVTEKVQGFTILGAIILLHEFGHCFGARWTGGQADEVMLWPLGGLAMAMSRRRPLPTFITVAAGPAVNVLIWVACVLSIYLISGELLLGPWSLGRAHPVNSTWLGLLGWLWWIHAINLALLIFNTLPVYPLDFGQLLQTVLWRPLGYYKSTLVTVNVGLVGSVLMVMVGIATLGSYGAGLMLIAIAVFCFMNCLRTRQMLVAEGPWGFSDEDGPDYGASLFGGATGGYGAPKKSPGKPKPRGYKPAYRTDDDEEEDDRRPGWRDRLAERRSEKQRAADAAERRDVDRVLAKVSSSGLASLTRAERKTLERATAHSRKRAVKR